MRILCVTVFFVLLAPSQALSQDVDSLLTLQVVDLTPQFLTFYEAALDEDADADRRWELWQEHDGFAAVPPTEAGQEMARAKLEQAWPRYPDWMDQIEAGAEGIEPDPEDVLRDVATLLKLDRPLAVNLLVFVGSGEADAFMAAFGGQIQVAIPVNQEPETTALALGHEFTHAAHHVLAGLPGGWERSIAQTILSEGIAMHATRALYPGGEPLDYVHGSQAWWDDALERRDDILRGIRGYLAASDSATLERFMMGTGTTGLNREAYVAGWFVVQDLLEDGATLAELARIEPEALPSFVEKTIDRMVQ